MNQKLPSVIATDEEYRFALRRAEELFWVKRDTPEGDELEIWITLIEDYEDREFPMGASEPITRP